MKEDNCGECSFHCNLLQIVFLETFLEFYGFCIRYSDKIRDLIYIIEWNIFFYFQ